MRKNIPAQTNSVFNQVESENVRNAPKVDANSHNNIFGSDAPVAKQSYAKANQQSSMIFAQDMVQQTTREVPINNIFGDNYGAPTGARVEVSQGSVSDPAFQASVPINRGRPVDNIFGHEANVAADAANNRSIRAQAQASTDLFSTMSQQVAPKSRARQAPGGTSSIVIG